MNEELDKLIEAKKAEIAKYKIILNNYIGRWWNMGKTHLEKLEHELKVLENDSHKNRTDSIS